MTVSLRDLVVLTLIHLTPPMMLSLLGHWQYIGWIEDENNECSEASRIAGLCLKLYKPTTPHKDDTALEYTIISLMFFFRIVPRFFSLLSTAKQFLRFVGMWQNSHSYGGRMLFSALVCILLDKFILPIAVLALSWWVAFFGSTSLMQVLFRLLFFEFLLELEIPIVKEYLKLVHPTQCMRIFVENMEVCARQRSLLGQ